MSEIEGDEPIENVTIYLVCERTSKKGNAYNVMRSFDTREAAKDECERLAKLSEGTGWDSGFFCFPIFHVITEKERYHNEK